MQWRVEHVPPEPANPECQSHRPAVKSPEPSVKILNAQSNDQQKLASTFHAAKQGPHTSCQDGVWYFKRIRQVQLPFWNISGMPPHLLTSLILSNS